MCKTEFKKLTSPIFIIIMNTQFGREFEKKIQRFWLSILIICLISACNNILLTCSTGTVALKWISHLGMGFRNWRKILAMLINTQQRSLMLKGWSSQTGHKQNPRETETSVLKMQVLIRLKWHFFFLLSW